MASDSVTERAEALGRALYETSPGDGSEYSWESLTADARNEWISAALAFLGRVAAMHKA